MKHALIALVAVLTASPIAGLCQSKAGPPEPKTADVKTTKSWPDRADAPKQEKAKLDAKSAELKSAEREHITAQNPAEDRPPTAPPIAVPSLAPECPPGYIAKDKECVKKTKPSKPSPK